MRQENSPGWTLTRIAQLRGVPMDAVRLQCALNEHGEHDDGAEAHAVVRRIVEYLGWPGVAVLAAPDRACLPLLVKTGSGEWGVLIDAAPGGGWILERNGVRLELEPKAVFAQVIQVFTPPVGQGAAQVGFAQQIRHALRKFRGTIAEAIAASFFINLITAVVSFFSLQVYDKVIPSRSMDTLEVMLMGVLLLIGLEWLMKQARSRVMDSAIAGIDAELSSEIFQRLLKVRLDRMPGSVGSLAGQLRGYEQVRAFYTASTLFSLVDLPAAVIFLAIICAVATPWLALVPLVMTVASIIFGILFRHRIKQLATNSIKESNMKTGLLVETVEGAETIKSSQGGWQFLSKWVGLCSRTIANDLRMRHTSEGLNYYLAASQQISYVCLVSLGAVFVTQGMMTMGGLIASSILGGKVLAAVMMVPNLMVQHAYARESINGIEAIYQLQTDNDGVSRPLTPTKLRGDYSLHGVAFAYPDSPPALRVTELQIRAGERVGILGPIGSGKSTMLKVIAGLYHPAQGRVLLDGLDISHIARESMSRQIGYLQQDHRLFQGTLRENLLVGVTDPGDDAIQEALRLTGLDQFVSAHPRGLELPIYEGGRGLSGGQKQLVAFTRMALNRPRILLLDEPTASMDDTLEHRCMQVLQSEAFAGCTLVVVTHKVALLPLVSRLVVLAGGQVLMDGPKDAVLDHLRQPKPVSQDTKLQTHEQVQSAAQANQVPVAAQYASGRMRS